MEERIFKVKLILDRVDMKSKKSTYEIDVALNLSSSINELLKMCQRKEDIKVTIPNILYTVEITFENHLDGSKKKFSMQNQNCLKEVISKIFKNKGNTFYNDYGFKVLIKQSKTYEELIDEKDYKTIFDRKIQLKNIKPECHKYFLNNIEYFMCFICNSILYEPKMCNSCSSIFCKECKNVNNYCAMEDCYSKTIKDIGDD